MGAVIAPPDREGPLVVLMVPRVVQDLRGVQEVQEVQGPMDQQGHRVIVCLVILILLGKVPVLVMEQLDKLIYKKEDLK